MNTDDSIVNTNACINATSNSRKFINIVNTTDTKVSLKFNTYSELSFNIDRTYIDTLTGNKNTHLFYDRIEHPRLILLDNIGYFQIQAPDMSTDNFRESKTITAYSSEYALSQKYITDLHINTGEVDSVETYNVGTGRGLSVLEILNAFETVNDVKVPYEIVGRRTGDIEQVWADSSYANKMLNWKAEVSLEETMRSIWKWQLYLAEQEEDKSSSNGGKILGGS